jgi:aryl-alcohol dehydrogenase-like predicted oxidoreductase
VEYRLLGNSGLKVSALSFGTATFGGASFFKAFGETQVDEAKKLVDLCIDAGVNLFDTADMYSYGQSEEILGQTLKGKRDKVLVATKMHMKMSDEVNSLGASRHHILRSVENSLKRLQTDYIDLYQLHNIDMLTDFEQTLRALDDLVRSGKVRYIGVSNYSAWHLMKALGISERKNLERFVALQAYYSLVARELENEFLPLCVSEGVGVLVWGPLSGGFLSGKFKRGQKADPNTRRGQIGDYGVIDEEKGFDVVDELEKIAKARNVSVSQVALNWILRKPAIASVILGARNEVQLKDTLKTSDWSLTPEEFARLDAVSKPVIPYPYWHQHENSHRLPPIVHQFPQAAAKELAIAK